MDQKLQPARIAEEATPGSGSPVVGNDTAALQAAHQSAALWNCSHWGCIQVKGGDRLRFLHNQSTNDFYRLAPGQGCDTLFVTATARTIDLVTAYVLEESVLLRVAPSQRQALLSFLDRYIFFADQVTLTDTTDQTGVLSLMGPQSHQLLAQLSHEDWHQEPPGSHRLTQLQDIPVRVAVGTGLGLPGYTLLMDRTKVPALWQQLVTAGAVPMGDQAWEELRITQGRPLPGTELTTDYNPLEAGLWHLISFDKGCYIGQETIARLDTYKGVKQQLWGVQLGGPVAPGSLVTVGGEKVGQLTSVVTSERGVRGLAYIRTRAGGAGLTVQIGPVTGEIVDVPFLSHGRR